MELNERLKLVRKSLGLSQEAFGKRLGVTGAGISKIESGDRNLTEQMLLHICQVYGVSEDWLRTGQGAMCESGARQDQKWEEARRIFQALRPEFQDYALDQIRKLAELQNK